jgi:hypothetical protein
MTAATFVHWGNAVTFARLQAGDTGTRQRVERDPSPGVRLWRVRPIHPANEWHPERTGVDTITLPPGYRPARVETIHTVRDISASWELPS